MQRGTDLQPGKETLSTQGKGDLGGLLGGNEGKEGHISVPRLVFIGAPLQPDDFPSLSSGLSSLSGHRHPSLT